MREGWEIKKLGEISEELFAGGDVPKNNSSKFQNDDFQIPIFTNGEKNKGLYGFTNIARVTKPSITISARGTIGYSEIRTEPFYPAIRLIVIVPKTDFLDLSFLKYVVGGIEFKHSGSSIPQLTVPMIKDYQIPIPPLHEQQHLVAILDKAFATIAKAKANAEKNLKNAKDIFESYLQRVFDNKGEDWEEKTLGELASFRNGMNFTKSSKGEKIYIVGVKDFQNSFWVPFETLETVTLDGKLNDLDLLNEGDILTVRSNGNPQLIGRTLLANEVVGKVSHSGFTIRIRLNTKNIDPIYLCNYLKIPKTRKILVDGGNGVGIKSLNQGALSELSIPYPKSLKTQQIIVQKLDAISIQTKKLEAIYQQKINELEELKKAVLQKAFSGELTSQLVSA